MRQSRRAFTLTAVLCAATIATILFSAAHRSLLSSMHQTRRVIAEEQRRLLTDSARRMAGSFPPGSPPLLARGRGWSLEIASKPGHGGPVVTVRVDGISSHSEILPSPQSPDSPAR